MISEEQIEAARKTISTGRFEPVGYRVLIKPIGATTGLEEAQKAMAPELTKLGLVTKTDEQAERETRGTHYGIVIGIGSFAYKTEQLGSEPWVDQGDIVLFDRYAGVDIEHPPGSGDICKLMNDESILGRVR